MSNKQSLSRQAMTLIVARGISFILTLGIPFVLSRYLTKSEFGAYRQSILFFTTVLGLLPWGMAQSLYYFIPKEPENRTGYLANSFLFLLLVGSIAFFGFFLGGPIIENNFHSPELARCSWLLGLYTFFMIATLYSEVALVSDNRVGAAGKVILLNEVAKAFAMIGGAVISGTFTGIMVGLVIAGAARFVLMTFYFRRDLITIFHGPDFTLLRKQWQYAMPFGLTVLFIYVQDYFHQYYIAYSFNPAEFAIYSVGCLQLPLVDLFYSSIGDVSMVKMAEHLRVDDKAAARAIWHEAMIKLAIIFIPLTIYLVAVGNQFITVLYTDKYHASVPIFLVTLIAMPLSLLLTDPALRVFGSTRFLLTISIIRLPITITMVIVGIKMFGMIGAAISTFATLLLVRIVMLGKISRLMETGIRKLLPWTGILKVLAASIGAVLPTGAVLLGLKSSPLIALLVTCPIYGLSFLVLGLSLDIFPAEERQMVRAVFNRINGYIFARPNQLEISNTGEIKLLAPKAEVPIESDSIQIKHIMVNSWPKRTR